MKLRIRLRKLKHAGVLGSVAALLLLGGTGYAAFRWLDPNSSIDQSEGITHLPNGNIRFWINADACQGQSQPDKFHEYYEIKAGARITPEQLTAHINSMCEADMLMEFFPEILDPYGSKQSGKKWEFKPHSEQYFTPYAKLKSIGPDYIVVDSGLNGTEYKDVRLPLDQGARLYYKGAPAKVSELEPGKWLTLVTHTSALDQPYSTETLRPEELNKLSKDGFPIGATVKGAIQHKYPLEIELNIPADGFTRLERDKNAPDGWRQITPLDSPSPQKH